MASVSNQIKLFSEEMLVNNFECALCKKKHFSPEGLENNLPVQVNKFVLKQLGSFDGQLQVTCDLSPESIVLDAAKRMIFKTNGTKIKPKHRKS